MKIDYFSALDRLFPYWTAASSLQNANLPCRRLVRFWFLSPEDYKEPEEAFKKVGWDEVGFVDYFPNKSTSAQIGYSEWWEVRSFSQVTWCSQSHLVVSLSLFLFCVSYQSLFFLFFFISSLFLEKFVLSPKLHKRRGFQNFRVQSWTAHGKRSWQNHTKFVRASLLLLSMGNCKKSPQCNLTVT